MYHNPIKTRCKDVSYFSADLATINELKGAKGRDIIPMVESNPCPIEFSKFIINIGSFAPHYIDFFTYTFSFTLNYFEW